MLTFAYPWLAVLLPLPLLVRFVAPPFRDARAAVRVPFFELLTESVHSEAAKGASVRSRSILQTLVFTVAWICFVAALAKPQWLEPPISRDLPTRDMMLLIDLSGSMETEDFVNAAGEKVDRLTAVKEVVADFVKRRRGDRVAMIVFGTGAFVQIPFTQDLEVCQELLMQTAPRMAGPKTALGDAIGLGVTLFERSEVEDRVMIALTDGNDTGSRVPPQDAARIAADRDITIHTIAVGDPTAAGEEKLDEEALQSVAKTTNGKYYRANDRDELAGIYDELDKADERQVETITHQPRIDLYQWPLGFALVITLFFQFLMLARRILPDRAASAQEVEAGA